MKNNNLHELRKKCGLTQLQLAIACQLHPSQIALIERGARCNQETAVKIANALGEMPEVVFPNFDTLRSW